MVTMTYILLLQNLLSLHQKFLMQDQHEQTDFDTKLMGLNEKINTNKTKLLLVENEFKNLQTFDSIYFRGKSHFEKDCTQNYLVFQPMYKYF